MKESGKATATMRTALACVVFFYSANLIKPDTKYIGRGIPSKPTLPHRSPIKEVISAILESANLRGDALVGTLASTGIRFGTIPSLKLRHKRKAKPEDLEHHDCSCKDRSQSLRFDGYLLNVYEVEKEQYFTYLARWAGR
jgi:hypothetical protein